MCFDRVQFVRLCQASAFGHNLTNLQHDIQKQLVLLEDAALLPVQKAHLRGTGVNALEIIDNRRTDPVDLARSIQRFMRSGETPRTNDLEAIDDWLYTIIENERELPENIAESLTNFVTYLTTDSESKRPEDRPEQLDIRRPAKHPDWIRIVLKSQFTPVDKKFLLNVRRYWSSVPEKDYSITLQETERTIERLSPFIETSPDADWVNGTAIFAARLLDVLPIASQRREEFKTKIRKIIPKLSERCRIEREDQSLLTQRVLQCLDLYESQLLETINNKTRFQQAESYILQVNFFRTNNIIDSGRLKDEDVELFKTRLDDLESRFNSVRYMSSTSVYQMEFAAVLERLQDEAESAIDFKSFRDRLKRMSANTKRQRYNGQPGVNKLTKYHAELIQQQINTIWKVLDKRYDSPNKMLATAQYVSNKIEELKVKPILTRRSIQREQLSLGCVARWGRYIIERLGKKISKADVDAVEDALEQIGSNFSICQQLWTEIDQRYEGYVKKLEEEIEDLRDQIDSESDLQFVYDEIRGFRNTIEDNQSPLHQKDALNLKRTLKRLWPLFWSRTTDIEELHQCFNKIDHRLEVAASKIRRTFNFEDIATDVRQLAWRVARVRDRAARNSLDREINKSFARIKGLKRKREQHLLERAKQQTALAKELEMLINEVSQEAEANPGKPAAWQALVEANRELLGTHQIRGTKLLNALKAKLDASFDRVREERAQFARIASIVHSQYMEIINNVMIDLERTEPPPERADALDAIETIKPLRIKLKKESRLLKAHLQEIFENLRLVSDAIDEIFEDVDSKERQAQLTRVENQIKAFNKRISSITSGGAVGKAIGEHKKLYRVVKETKLSMDGRARCREQLDFAWSIILEIKSRFGRNRFERQNLETTILELERQGHFAWMEGVPNIA